MKNSIVRLVMKRREYADEYERCRELASYIVDNAATVRQTAKYFGISKSTVHKDVTVKLKKTDQQLYADVKAVIEKNKAERHIRGGLATKNKYARIALHKHINHAP